METSQVKKSFDVLDHGLVKYVGHHGGDEKALEWARMSTGNPTGIDVAQDDRTREYLWREQHVSPFEGPILELEVQAPIFTIREWFRHDQHVNEASARYTKLDPVLYRPSVERLSFAGQDPVKKQGSGFPMSLEDVAWFQQELDELYKAFLEFYDEADRRGFAREVSRIPMPVGHYSRFRVQTTARNWLFFLKSRLAPGAQWEIRQYAEAVAAIVREIWPKTWEVFEEYTVEGAMLSRAEKAVVSEVFSDIFNLGDVLKPIAKKHAVNAPALARLLAKLGLEG